LLQSVCETQLLETVNDLTVSLNSGNQMDILLLDFSKAFDKVSHPHLLYKLTNYGIRGSLFNWINDILKDRQQQVLLQNERSQSCSVFVRSTTGFIVKPFTFSSLHK